MRCVRKRPLIAQLRSGACRLTPFMADGTDSGSVLQIWPCDGGHVPREYLDRRVVLEQCFETTPDSADCSVPNPAFVSYRGTFARRPRYRTELLLRHGTESETYRLSPE